MPDAQGLRYDVSDADLMQKSICYTLADAMREVNFIRSVEGTDARMRVYRESFRGGEYSRELLRDLTFRV